MLLFSCNENCSLFQNCNCPILLLLVNLVYLQLERMQVGASIYFQYAR